MLFRKKTITIFSFLMILSWISIACIAPDISTASPDFVKPFQQTTTIIQPNGGEFLQGGSSYDIMWTISGTGIYYFDKLYYSVDGGSSWTHIADVLTPFGIGTYTWSVPYENSNTCLVKVESSDFGQNTSVDVSDAYFTIASGSVEGNLAGNVTSGGNPLSGADITAYESGTSIVAGTAISAADGSYLISNLPEGYYDVQATKSGYNPSALQQVYVIGFQTVYADFDLTKAQPTTGDINGNITSAGAPLGGATITAYYTGTTNVAGSATSAANGSYSIVNLSPGDYDVVTSKSGYKQKSQTVRVVAGRTAWLDFDLDAEPTTGSIFGTVTSSGSPLQDAKVTVYVVNTASVVAFNYTNPDGSYRIDNLQPATYDVQATKDYYLPSTKVAVSVVAGRDSRCNFDLQPAPGAISGQVTSKGSALPGATVTAYYPGTNNVAGSNQTKADGTYVINNLRAGTYEVQATCSGYKASPLVTADVLNGRTTQNINFDLEVLITTGWLEGYVKSLQTNTPVKGAVVILVGTQKAATTGADGHYNISGIQPGRYDVKASAAGYEETIKQNIPIEAGKTTKVDFKLQPLPTEGSVEGVVTDMLTKSPIAGARINVVGKGISTTTNAEGYYVLRNLSAGFYDIEASADNYHSVTKNIEVKAGEVTTLNFELQIEASASVGWLAGDVKNVNGKPIPTAIVKIYREGNFVKDSSVDEWGEFNISLPQGRYLCEVAAKGYENFTSEVTVVSGKTTQIFVTLRKTEADRKEEFAGYWFIIPLSIVVVALVLILLYAFAQSRKKALAQKPPAVFAEYLERIAARPPARPEQALQTYLYKLPTPTETAVQRPSKPVQPPSPPPPPPPEIKKEEVAINLDEELKKLDEFLKKGLITEEEYKASKQRLIEQHGKK